jgi:hypothetical protein
MQDKLFPFLVQEKMPDSRAIVESTHLGPGTYSPTEVSSRPMPLVKTLLRKNAKKTVFGAGQARF